MLEMLVEGEKVACCVPRRGMAGLAIVDIELIVVSVERVMLEEVEMYCTEVEDSVRMESESKEEGAEKGDLTLAKPSVAPV